MKIAKFIATDIESGGIGEKASLLTAYFGIFDEKLELITELDLKIGLESENDFYSVSAKALEINKIDLVEHQKNSITASAGGQKLYKFLYNIIHYNHMESPDAPKHLIPLGHNVPFDIKFINDKLLKKGTWDQFVSYRVLDTATVGQFLKEQGKIPHTVSGSLTSYMKHFNLEFGAEGAHSARGDTLATVAVFKEMLKL